MGIHEKATLPKFSKQSFSAIYKKLRKQKKSQVIVGDKKVVIFTTCYVNYNLPNIAKSALIVLEKNNVEVKFIYPECCGMPKLEAGDLPSVVKKAERISKELISWVEKGYKVLTLTPSCSLMLKSEWQLLAPENEIIKRISLATQDICEYVVNIAKSDSLFQGSAGIEKNISLHVACHTKAQNIGIKSSEMLKFIPSLKIKLVDKCSGHGGSFGVRKETYPLAEKYGKISARKISSEENTLIVSECPLAGQHLAELKKSSSQPLHPIEILAESYMEKES